MAWIEFKGVSSETLLLPVVSMAGRTIARRRVQTYDVHGRPGDLTTVDGTRETFRQDYRLAVNGQSLATIEGWLRGSGDLITSDDPNRCWRARIDDEITYERVRNLYDTTIKDVLTVTFTCQPYKYQAVPVYYEFPEQGSAARTATITNAGNIASAPRIEVWGDDLASGVLTVNGEPIELGGLAANAPIVIDSEAGRAYHSDPARSATMDGDFPLFPTGDTTLVWTGEITKVRIYPAWRWD